MTTGDALLAAIWERPHDDLPRLAYADWLDDQGDADRAEFIRVQCELARWDEWDDGYEPLADREAELWQRWGVHWKQEVGCQGYVSRFHRGFPTARSGGRMSVTAFLTSPPDHHPASPLLDVGLAKPTPTLLGRLEASPLLRRVGRLKLYGGWLVGGAAGRLATAAGLANVADLTATGVTDGGLADYAATAEPPHLTELSLDGAVGDAGLAALVGSPLAPRLRGLDVRGCTGVSAAGVAAAIASPCLAGLQAFGFNHFDRGVVAAVTATRPAFPMRTLGLWLHNAEEVRLWAGWPGLESARHLHLGWAAGAVRPLVELVRLPQLAGLRALTVSLDRRPIDLRPVLAALTDPAVLPALRRLTIPERPGGDLLAGLKARFGTGLRGRQ